MSLRGHTMAADGPGTILTFKAGRRQKRWWQPHLSLSNQESPEDTSTYVSLARTRSHGHPRCKEGWEVGD